MGRYGTSPIRVDLKVHFLLRLRLLLLLPECTMGRYRTSPMRVDLKVHLLLLLALLLLLLHRSFTSTATVHADC